MENKHRATVEDSTLRMVTVLQCQCSKHGDVSLASSMLKMFLAGYHERQEGSNVPVMPISDCTA